MTLYTAYFDRTYCPGTGAAGAGFIIIRDREVFLRGGLCLSNVNFRNSGLAELCAATEAIRAILEKGTRIILLGDNQHAIDIANGKPAGKIRPDMSAQKQFLIATRQDLRNLGRDRGVHAQKIKRTDLFLEQAHHLARTYAGTGITASTDPATPETSERSTAWLRAYRGLSDGHPRPIQLPPG